MTIGIDEVGRGCWAGPLVACAVALDEATEIDGLTDSKKLTENKRLKIAQQINESSAHIGVGWVWSREINTIGLTKSVQLAMTRAIKQIDHNGHKIIIDGNINYLSNILCNKNSCNRDHPCKLCKNITAVVKADGSVAAVSAASVVAKVARDQYMKKIAKKYSGYGFEKHVGYGTKQHLSAIKEHGVLPIHRINYKPIKALLA